MCSRRAARIICECPNRRRRSSGPPAGLRPSPSRKRQWPGGGELHRRSPSQRTSAGSVDVQVVGPAADVVVQGPDPVSPRLRKGRADRFTGVSVNPLSVRSPRTFSGRTVSTRLPTLTESESATAWIRPATVLSFSAKVTGVSRSGETGRRTPLSSATSDPITSYWSPTLCTSNLGTGRGELGQDRHGIGRRPLLRRRRKCDCHRAVTRGSRARSSGPFGW